MFYSCLARDLILLISVFLGPAMDLMRSPKAGRGWESFGPDPWLNGEAAYETIVAVQSVGVVGLLLFLYIFAIFNRSSASRS